MTPATRLTAIGEVIQQHGPLFVRAVVASYAKRDMELGNYAPWFLAHTDLDQLSDDRLAQVTARFDGRWDCGLEELMAWLEEQGYLVLNTAPYEGWFTVQCDEKNEDPP